MVGGFGSLPGAIVGGVLIGVVESFAGFYLPEGLKDIAAYVVVLVMLVAQAQRAVRRESVQESLTLRFIFKTDYDQDIDLARHGGHIFWYGALLLALLCAPWWLGPYGLTQLSFVLIYAIVGPRPDAAGRLYGPVLDGPRGLPRRGRLCRGQAFRDGLALSGIGGRALPCFLPLRAWWWACLRCAPRASTSASPRSPSA